MEACFLEWDEYPLPGVTYAPDLNPLYHSPFTIFRHADKNNDAHQVHSSKAVLNNELSLSYRLTNPGGDRLGALPRNVCDSAVPGPSHQPCTSGARDAGNNDGNHSSVSSEGFCENEEEILVGSGGESPSSEASSSGASSEGAARREDAASDDDCQLYFYEGRAPQPSVPPAAPAPPSLDATGWETGWEALFARAEGLQAHGHTREASALGARLARELLARPPALRAPPRRPRKHAPQLKVSAAAHRLSWLASATLARCAFLASVLSEHAEHHELAFRVGLFALELVRPPAATKALEVKLNNQESELVALLKRLPTAPAQLALARDKAVQLRDGTLRNRGPALLPIALASFLFDVLVLSVNDNKHPARLPTDEALGFEAAVAALGLKANVSEAEHPLLCEGTRRQRGELALTLLSAYKDDPVRLARIMNKLLDRDIHQLTKGPMVSMYYTASGRLPPRAAPPHVAHPAHTYPPHPAPLASAPADVCADHPPVPQPAPQPQPQPTPPTITRHKDSRYKGKRVYPVVPNQPSEAGAHFMFELAKSVLVKAGGSSSTSLFTQTSCAREPHPPHRGLHMAAFQLGLYALGLHNCVSANWLSRTYSSHVSWITGQAMDIGAPAILFLIDAWEGHLTPPEAAGIADKASSGRDASAVRAAAELALSVLPHAHALNYNEIQRAVLQCKEQSDAMLERACLIVEAAAKGGGVYPEVLYTVARYWHELGQRAGEEDEPRPPPQLQQQIPAGPQYYHPAFAYYPPPLYPLPYATPAPPFALQPYFVRGLVASHPPHALPPPHAIVHQAHPPPIQVTHGAPIPPPLPLNTPPPAVAAPPALPPSQLRRLLAAYRVGMLALETQARRVHDDRPQNKFGRNPPYGEHVKWLLRVCKRLGAQHVHQFCACAVNSVVSPFVLYELCVEAASWLARGQPPLAAGHLRGPLSPLVHKCQQMYIQSIHQKLYHLTPQDYEEFVSIVLSARAAFTLTPEGHTQFKEWLASLRRSKSCKKDLWTQLNAALQTSGK